MSKPDDIPQDVWVSALATAILIFDKLMDDGRIAVISIAARDEAAVNIAKSIMEERYDCAEVVRKLIPSISPDGPINAAHEAEYSALGFAMTAIRKRGAAS